MQRNDEELAIFRRRRQVGLIYQFYNLIPVLNVVENMTLPVLIGRARRLIEQRSGGIPSVYLKLEGTRKTFAKSAYLVDSSSAYPLEEHLMNAPSVVIGG